MEDTKLIIEKIDSLKELFEERFNYSIQRHETTHNHLEKLNGQVGKNTRFRIKGGVYFKGLYVTVTVILIPTIYLIIDKLWK